MNIIVLGNGFDLAHGLPTRYTDFLKFCRDYNTKSPISDDKTVEAEFTEDIKDNVWLKYFLDITPDLNDDKTWIDFETEILNVIRGICPKRWLPSERAVSYNNNGVALTKEDFQSSKFNTFGDYISFPCDEGVYKYYLNPPPPQININGLYGQLRKLIRAFEIYCCLVINKKCGAKKRYRINKPLLSSAGGSLTKTYIVSFNYTRTFEKYYDSDASDSLIEYHYVYPHGDAKMDITFESANADMLSSGLVLGTRTFDRKNIDNTYNISTEFNVFQKHNQQHRYSTLSDFQQLLLSIRQNQTLSCPESIRFFVIGHSLDVSDHAKLRHLFNSDKEARITVFYHDEDSYQRYINNITDILGEEDVAVRVQFYHQNNITNGLLIPYWSFDDGRTSSDIIDSADEKVSELLTDYFLSHETPSELQELSSYSLVESVTANSIKNIELIDADNIEINGSGYIDVRLQYVSNWDIRHDIGQEKYRTYPLDFTLSLHIKKGTQETEDEDYLITKIDYQINTSIFSSESE